MTLPSTAKVTDAFIYIDAADVSQITSDTQFSSINSISGGSTSYNISGECIGYYGGTLVLIN